MSALGMNLFASLFITCVEGTGSPWLKTFPDEFFRQVYRLHNWEYRPEHK